MIIFGINPVIEAIRSDPARIRKVIFARGKGGGRIQEVIDEARSRNVPIAFEPHKALDRRSGSDQHQGVVAEVAAVEYADLSSLLTANPKLLLVVDGIEDPNNLGALIRTAEATGVDGLLLPQRRSCGITPAVVKASAGAAMHLKTARIGNVSNALKRLKEEGFWIVGLDMSGPTQAAEIDPSLNLALVVGGESVGLRKVVSEQCDFLVSLPMAGKVASLNLSVAAGVLLYTIEFSRRRLFGSESR